MSFPAGRTRRLRRTAALRRLGSETALSAADLIQPIFVVHGSGVRHSIPSMPGVAQLSVDEVLDKEIESLRELGVPAVLLFGIPAVKDAIGSENFAEDGIVQRAIRRIRERVPETIVMTDVCCCEYTDHGHCGVLRHDEVDNDATLEILGKVAVSHTAAGADVVAPSGMMDGMVAAIRAALDADGHSHLPIMSYAVKYASAFYGPFREAADGAPKFGDRKTHQMDPANVEGALREAALDVAEGADFLMVKPALPYLDVLSDARREFDVPLAAYHVSGEYSMIHAAAERGWIDGDRAMDEALVSIKRAGADWILSYAALEVAGRLPA